MLVVTETEATIANHSIKHTSQLTPMDLCLLKLLLIMFAVCGRDEGGLIINDEGLNEAVSMQHISLTA